jgi:hypothetical protein
MMSILWMVAGAHALQLDLSAAQLCGLSDRVIVAEVTSKEVLWASGAEGAIETHVWLTTLQVVTGKAPETIELVLAGGTIGELTHWVEDVPALAVDQTYLLFLKDTEAGAIVIGGHKGAVAVGPNGVALSTAVASVGACRVD